MSSKIHYGPIAVTTMNTFEFLSDWRRSCSCCLVPTGYPQRSITVSKSFFNPSSAWSCRMIRRIWVRNEEIYLSKFYKVWPHPRSRGSAWTVLETDRIAAINACCYQNAGVIIRQHSGKNLVMVEPCFYHSSGSVGKWTYCYDLVAPPHRIADIKDRLLWKEFH